MSETEQKAEAIVAKLENELGSTAEAIEAERNPKPAFHRREKKAKK
ncbi:hypothetical protein KIPB_014302, partial [Kipferlia bialata]|eukprot:g14302.t1